MNTTQKKFLYTTIVVLSLMVTLGFGGLRNAVFAAQTVMIDDAPNTVLAPHLSSQSDLVTQPDDSSKDASMELSGTVESFDGTTLTIDGKTIVLTDATEVKGDIQPGDVVKVEVKVADDGSLIASEVEPSHSNLEDSSSHDTTDDHSVDQPEGNNDSNSGSGQDIHEDVHSSDSDQDMQEDSNSMNSGQDMHEDDHQQDDDQNGNYQDGSHEDNDHHNGGHDGGHD